MTVNWEGFIAKANKTQAVLHSLPESARAHGKDALAILIDHSVPADQKLPKIEALFADQDADTKAKIHKLAERTVKFSVWMGQRLEHEDEEVKDAARKCARSLLCKEFLAASDSEKEAKLNDLVHSLNDKQLEALKKFREEAKTKDAELDH